MFDNWGIHNIIWCLRYSKIHQLYCDSFWLDWDALPKGTKTISIFWEISVSLWQQIFIYNLFQIEYFSKNKRTFAMAIDNAAGNLLGLTLPLIVYFNRTWTSMHIWAGIISAIALPTTLFAVPESSRWLVSNNRGTKAENILKDIAKGNNRNLTETQWKEIETILKNMATDADNPAGSKALNTWDMFRRNHVQKTLILMFNWVAAIVTQYALVLNMNDLAGDIFVNFVMMGIVELPGILLSYYFMNKLGKFLLIFLKCFKK
jgi:hypothetical protein